MKKIIFVLFTFLLFTNVSPAFADSTVTSTITTGASDTSLSGTTFNSNATTNVMGKNLTTSVNTFNLFSNIAIPKGATIVSAVVKLGTANSGGNIINVKIAAEAVGNGIAPTTATQFTSKQSSLTTSQVNWNNVTHGSWGTVITSPDIKTVIQEIVNRFDWNSGNNIHIWIGDNGSDAYSNNTFFTANFNGAGQKPYLEVVYSTGPTPTPTSTPTPTPTSIPTATLTPSPTLTPTVTLTIAPTLTPTITFTPSPTVTPSPTFTPSPSPTLTLTPTATMTPTSTPQPTQIPAGSTQTVVSSVISGLHDTSLTGTSFENSVNTAEFGKPTTTSVSSTQLFTGMTIPQGATIVSASLKYELAGSGGNTINVRIQGNNTSSPTAPVSASTFATVQANVTSSQVLWNNVTKGSWGTQIVSPDVSTIIQEIVNRSDWTSGNSIQILESDNGSGNYSHDTYFTGDFTGAGLKPQLTVTYSTGSNPTATPTPTQVLSPTPTATPLVTATPTTIPSPTPTIDPSSQTVVTIPVTFNTGSDIYYRSLTLVVHTGTVSTYSATGNGQPIPASYDATSGNVIVTTSASPVVLTLTGVTNPGSITVAKAALKDNKKWAWSHSFDDNVNLKASVDVLTAKGWRGTFFLIANVVDQTRDESWIVDKPYLVTKLNNGWSIGNHTWDHECTSPNSSTVTQGFGVEKDIVNSSQKTDYRVIAFAAPCYSSGYNQIISNMRTAGQNEVKFNETQGSGMMIINPGASAYSSGSYTADAVSSNTIDIGRDAEIDWAPANVTARMAWFSTNSSSTRNFWYNTYLHGERETNLATVVNYAYNNYGPGGTNEIWMAPSDEVYSYLTVRDNSVLGTISIQ